LLAPRIAALLETLPTALEGDVTAVHRARVASRRLREVLAPMRGLLSDGTAERARLEVRRVTRALGPVRELDVALALFDELATRDDLAEPAQVAVARALARDRDRAQRRMRAALTRRRRDRLTATLALLHDPEAADGTARLLAAVDARAARRGRRLRQAIDRAGALYLPERLHRVRIAVKQLRYVLEVAGDLRRGRPSARVTQLRRIQDLLGRAHDLHVLAERVRQVQTATVRTSRATAASLGRLADALDDDCRTVHGAFMSRRRGLVTLCDAIEANPTPRRQSVA
jgi:CHAD domain-containing protein